MCGRFNAGGPLKAVPMATLSPNPAPLGEDRAPEIENFSCFPPSSEVDVCHGDVRVHIEYITISCDPQSCGGVGVPLIGPKRVV